MAGKRAKLEDVAEVAQLARSTVADILRDGPTSVRYRDDTRRRVRDVARELNYVPRAAAKVLRGNSTGIIGLTIQQPPHLEEAAHYRMMNRLMPALDAVESELARHDYHLMFGSTFIKVADAGEDEVKPARWLCEHHVDGMIVAGAPDSRLVKELARLELPFVVVDCPLDEPYCYVTNDDFDSMMTAVQHLAQLGHRRIAWVRTSPSFRNDVHHRAYLDTMRKVGREPYPVGEFSLGIESYMEWLFTNTPPPTALIFHDDQDAGLALNWMRPRGLQAPKDISVTALITHEISLYLSPPLTAMEMDFAGMGRLAVGRLLRMLKDPTAPLGSVLIKPKLVVRESTGPPAQTNEAL